jgi:hypothetical protein
MSCPALKWSPAAEETAVDEQRAGAGAADHVERLGPGEVGTHRDQSRARPQRPQRGQHPRHRVETPDGHPVAGRDAVGDERAGDLADSLGQLPVADPCTAAVRLGQRISVAELPRRARDRRRDRQLHRSTLSNQAIAW